MPRTKKTENKTEASFSYNKPSVAKKTSSGCCSTKNTKSKTTTNCNKVKSTGRNLKVEAGEETRKIKTAVRKTANYNKANSQTKSRQKTECANGCGTCRKGNKTTKTTNSTRKTKTTKNCN